LASVVQTCSSSLRNEADVVCSDSAALIKAAQIDTVVWDKTGTLTEDTQALSLIVHPPWISQELEWNSSSRANNLGHTIPESMRDQFDKKYNKCHPLLHSVLVGCHSLRFECDENGSFNPVGDPLDIACLTDCPYDYYPDGVFTVQSNKSEAMDPLKMKKLWQIKTFPFDPNRRCSSSLALVLHHDNQFRLWALIKGSSEQLLNRFSHPPVNTNFTSTDFQGWYEGSSSTIGRLGMRTIALGVRNVSSDLRFFLRLFPDGLHTLQDDAQFNSKVKKARKWANENVERCMIEGFDSLLDNGKSSTEVVFDFVGICCFEAPLRRSTCRVVQELKKSGIRSIICTGDSVEAALAVANIVGISNQKNLAILNLRYDQDQPRLFWRLRDLGESESTIEISFRKFSFRKLSACKTIYPCLTGDAFLHLLDIHNHRIFTDEITFKLCSDLLLDVQRIVVLARASPSTKNLFVTSLRKVGSKVIFCGDGVNDVKALRESDLSVALLNGYSGLPSEKEDIEDDRRRERWHRKTMARLGTVLTATKMRLHLSMRESLDGSEPRQPTDILFAFCSAIQKELDRSRRLHEGGAKAAQILAKDDLLVKAHPSMATNRIKPDVTDSIKSGEACLASKFTCLRPCVDGIEFIIRYGIAASAFSLTLRRVTFLNCLMACFNLATLYRNGFRYGKYMWNIELFLAMVSGWSFV
jgi:magnesium-transporting ATPase (P-type)